MSGMAGRSLEGWRMRRPAQRPARPPRAVVDGAGAVAQEIRHRLERSARCEMTDRLDHPADVVVIADEGEPPDRLAARVRDVALRASRACPITAFVLVSPWGLSLCREAARAAGVPPWLVLATGAMPRASSEAARLAMRLGVSPGQVSVPVIGGDAAGPHAGQMVLSRYAAAGGVSVGDLQFVREEDLEAPRPQEDAGALLASAGAALALAVLGDTRRVLCCAGWAEGSFGLPGGFVSLPYPVGARGAEDPIPLRLTLEERALLQRVAAR